jgi:S-disulfanyl-L-cysteine oxidoreductase SoxD
MSACFRPERFALGGALALAWSLTACAASAPAGATNADMVRANDVASQGATLFAQGCAHCHGERGEGLAGASAILGAGALPEYPRDNSSPGASTPTDPQQLQIQVQTRPAGAPWRDPFRNAQNLFEFVSTHMPKTAAVALKSEDHWAVVTFMISAQGGDVPPGGINASNAASVLIPRR